MLRGFKLAALLCLITSIQGFSEEDVSTLEETIEEALTEIGNQICPVTGEAINNLHVYIHNGKVYNLCCSMCIKEFGLDPEKYAQIALSEVSTK